MNHEKRALLKVMLLGDGGVGKSSLMLRFTDDQFIEQHMSTLGVDYKNRGVMINGRAVNLQIWDTAGQERFRTITRVYYRRTQGVLLVFDVTNRSSFENVEYWMGNLEEHAAPETEKILVGNKSDLSDARQVSTAEAVALAARFNVAFHETSAAVGSSVEDAFMDLAGTVGSYLSPSSVCPQLTERLLYGPCRED
jgi:Ras-related protein Rab-1A